MKLTPRMVEMLREAATSPNGTLFFGYSDRRGESQVARALVRRSLLARETPWNSAHTITPAGRAALADAERGADVSGRSPS